MSLAYTEISKNKFKTVLLLMFFIAFVMAVGFALSETYYPGTGTTGLIIAAAISLFWTLLSYFAGDKITLVASGARQIAKKDNPELYRLVENLALTAGLPLPKIYIIDSPAPNAFATGRNPQHAVVAVTTGILQRLDKKELEGVLAHELSHIGNYDTRLLMIVTALAGVVMILTDMAWRIHFFGGSRSNDRDGRANAVMMIVGVVLIILAPLFATLIKLAISRRRESLADASGALLTRYPEGLASALEKIASDSHTLKTATKGTAHLYIVNPFKSGAWANLFSTHPPIEQRVRALRGMDV